MTDITIDARSVCLMTIDAPCHTVEVRIWSQFLIRRDITMTLLATHTFVYMRKMVEVYKVGNDSNTFPSDRFTTLPDFPEFNNLGLRRGNELMTSHTCFDRRYTGDSPPAYAAVTILTIDHIIGYMYLVTELYRLTGMRRLPLAGGDT
jgi:hypothetical protein